MDERLHAGTRPFMGATFVVFRIGILVVSGLIGSALIASVLTCYRRSVLIMPCDEAAANSLGLSTQVPARYIYFSNGPNRKYVVGDAVLEFRHRCTRETGMKGRNARIIIRGLKGLGRIYATPEVVTQIASRYSDAEWRAVCEEAVLVSDWISRLLWNEMKRREGANDK